MLYVVVWAQTALMINTVVRKTVFIHGIGCGANARPLNHGLAKCFQEQRAEKTGTTIAPSTSSAARLTVGEDDLIGNSVCANRWKNPVDPMMVLRRAYNRQLVKRFPEERAEETGTTIAQDIRSAARPIAGEDGRTGGKCINLV